MTDDADQDITLKQKMVTSKEKHNTITMDELIEVIGCKQFSVQLVILIGIIWMSEAVETNLVALIGPELKCVWNLSNFQVSLTSSSVFIGAGLGSIYWGYFADKYGRKLSMVFGIFITIYFGLLSAASSNFVWFLLTRFMVGFGLGPAPLSAGYISEFISRKHRGKAVITIDIFYAFGSIYISLIAMLTIQQVSWQMFLILAALPASIFFISSPWLPESIRFLQKTAKYDAIMKIVNRLSLLSKIPVPKNRTVACDLEQVDLKLLLTPKYRIRLAIITIVFISSFWCYFGAAQLNTEILQAEGICNLLTKHPSNNTNAPINCHRLTTKDYTQNIVVVLAELPGICLVVLLVDKIGRKWFLFTLAVCSGIVFIFLNVCISRTFTTVLMFILRFLVIGFAQLPYLLASELFPTVVRASAIGIAVGVAKISLVAVPYFVQYLLFVSVLATTSVFCCLCFLSAILVLFLPETKNKMLDTI